MVFSTLSFLFLFLPIVCIGYIIIPSKYANYWLFLMSLFFYYMGAKKYILVLIGTIMIAYLGGRLIEKATDSEKRKLLLSSSTFCLLLLLCYFKYWNFLIENISHIIHADIQASEVIYPIGISFFIFQALSYIVDVYRGEEALRNFADVGLYISFFPQLIAGPIVKFKDIRSYLDTEYRKLDFSAISEGIWRFSIGLCKKVLLANALGGLADIVYGVTDITKMSIFYTWLGAIAYTMQIYYDFSGYSDMAIGLGRMFGFCFKENFDYPYAAGSIRDFWKRWHISLSQFFRDYLYIPMGGSRRTVPRNLVNLFVVWFLTGLWHGASWNFVVWGLLYGVAVLVERIIVKRNAEQECATEEGNVKSGKELVFSGMHRILTIIIVVLLWVIFRSDDLSKAIAMIGNMFGIGSGKLIDQAFVFQAGNYALLMVVAAIFCLPVAPYLRRKLGDNIIYRTVSAVLLMVGVILSVACIYMGSYNPFLYYMF